MKFIGLVGSGYFLSSQTMDGRFIITDGVCYDLLLNQITNIIPPKYTIPDYYPSMNGAFINLALQETVVPMWKLDGAGSFTKMGRFDFAGNLKSFFLLDRPSSWNVLSYAFGFWNGQYHILSDDTQDGATNYCVFKIAEGGEAVTVQRFTEPYDYYGTWNFPNGLVYVGAYTLFQAEFNIVGSVPEFAPVYDTVGYPASYQQIKSNIGGVFKGQAVLGLLNSTGNVTLPANGFASVGANDGMPYAVIAGLRFALQFDPAYAGLIIRGLMFYREILYAVLDGNRLFSAVYYPRFSHNFSDNFARGVPIAGSHRS